MQRFLLDDTRVFGCGTLKPHPTFCRERSLACGRQAIDRVDPSGDLTKACAFTLSILSLCRKSDCRKLELAGVISSPTNSNTLSISIFRTKPISLLTSQHHRNTICRIAFPKSSFQPFGTATPPEAIGLLPWDNRRRHTKGTADAQITDWR